MVAAFDKYQPSNLRVNRTYFSTETKRNAAMIRSSVTLITIVISLLLIRCTNTQKTTNGEARFSPDDEELFTKVQEQTFQYFWEGAEPNSGMARERIHID